MGQRIGCSSGGCNDGCVVAGNRGVPGLDSGFNDFAGGLDTFATDAFLAGLARRSTKTLPPAARRFSCTRVACVAEMNSQSMPQRSSPMVTKEWQALAQQVATQPEPRSLRKEHRATGARRVARCNSRPPAKRRLNRAPWSAQPERRPAPTRAAHTTHAQGVDPLHFKARSSSSSGQAATAESIHICGHQRVQRGTSSSQSKPAAAIERIKR